MEKEVLVFDFDGVLSIPWSMPEKYYPQIPELLQNLSKKCILCVASYNPRAELAIRDYWKLDKYFTCMRSGANHTWNEFYNENYRKDLCKGNQIVHMLKNEIKELGCKINKITFFDDDPINIKIVNEKLPQGKNSIN